LVCVQLAAAFSPEARFRPPRGMAILPISTHGQDARATPRGMAILPISTYRQDARATPRGMAILAMSTHGQDARATAGGTPTLTVRHYLSLLQPSIRQDPGEHGP